MPTVANLVRSTLLGAAISACSSSQQGAVDALHGTVDSPPSAGIGGDIYLLYQSVSGAPTAKAHAEFYSDLTLGSQPYPLVLADLPMETCAPAVTYTAATGTYADVGPSVTASAVGAVITMTRFARMTEIFYEPLSGLTALTVGTSYDLAITGNATYAAETWPAGIHVPQPVTLSSPPVVNNTITAPVGSSLTLSWTPTDSHELSVVLIPTTSAPRWNCRLADDGSFEIPATVIDALPASTLMVLSGIHVTEHPFHGRTIYAKGQFEQYLQLDHN